VKTSAVSVVSVKESIQEAVREAMEMVSWKDHLERGKPTSLKVNLGWELFIPGSITSPWVVEGVIQTIRDWVGPISIVESDQVLERIEVAYRKSGMPELCRRYGVSWVNMSHGETRTVEVDRGVIFPKLELPTILLETQVVTIPVMKTHAKTGITGSVKNQWGCISKLRHNFHLVLSDALADINATVAPKLSVMDATVGLEGNGPKSGVPRIVNHVLASSDIVALDTVQATIMGLDPRTVDHLKTCADRGIGTNELEQIEIKGASDIVRSGENKFLPAQHNLVSKIEEGLRRSRLKWLFFDTPIFTIMLLGAKVWYVIWFYLVSGKKHWNVILQDPFYGPLWKKVLEHKTI
jgi:uncharacterized protein (DUF362 family)